MTTRFVKAGTVHKGEQIGVIAGRAYSGPAGTPLEELIALHRLNTAWLAKDELVWRLNERLQGRDPGKPFHWRGIR